MAILLLFYVYIIIFTILTCESRDGFLWIYFCNYIYMAYKDQLRQWLSDHPNATVEEAIEAGYFISCDNWCKRRR